MEISGGDLAGIIAAAAFFVIAVASLIPALKLGKFFQKLAQGVEDAVEHSLPLIDETTRTVQGANNIVQKVDPIVTAANRTAQNVSATVEIYTALIAKPAAQISKFSKLVTSKIKEFRTEKTAPKPAAPKTPAQPASPASAAPAPSAPAPAAPAQPAAPVASVAPPKAGKHV